MYTHLHTRTCTHIDPEKLADGVMVPDSGREREDHMMSMQICIISKCNPLPLLQSCFLVKSFTFGSLLSSDQQQAARRKKSASYSTRRPRENQFGEEKRLHRRSADWSASDAGPHARAGNIGCKHRRAGGTHRGAPLSVMSLA